MFLFSSVSIAQPAPPSGKKWQKIENMSDEFNGSSLNRDKWDDQDPQWEGRKPARFEKSSVSVGGGNLKIVASKKNNPFGGWTHNGGLVRSLAKNTYGYYEARIKGGRTALSTTFWLINKRNELKNCPRVVELDILETVGQNAQNRGWINNFIKNMNTNAHSRNVQCRPNEKLEAKKTAAIGEENWRSYHTYGVWWKNKRELLFYLDGKLMHKTTPPADYDIAMYLRMVVESYDWNKPKDGSIQMPQYQV